MLTDPLLLSLVQSDQLKLWRPESGVRVRERRALLLEREVALDVDRKPWPREVGELGVDANLRRRQLHGFLARYVNGEGFWANQHIKGLDPQDGEEFRDLIEFRSMPPEPQTRLFCAAFSPGVLIGLYFGLRAGLGDRGDPRWSGAAQKAKARWQTLFGSRSPLTIPIPLDTRSKLKAVFDD